MGVLLIALAVRAACYLFAAGHPERFLTDDATQYVTIAGDLKSAYFDAQSPRFTLGLFRTPGYPFFLAGPLRALGGSLHAIVLIQIAISVLTVGLTVWLARGLVGRRAAVVGGLVLALDPATALYACFVQPETLFIALVVAGVLSWVTAMERDAAGVAALSGLLLGFAALTRPIGLFLPLGLPLTVLLRPRTRRLGTLVLCFLVASAIPIGGWMAKNQVLTGVPVFTILGDSSLLHYRAAGALAEDEGISIDEARARVWRRFWSTATPGATVAELSRGQRALAIEILSEHKWASLRMMGHAVLRMAAGTGLTALSNLAGDSDPEGVATTGKAVAQALQLLVMGIAYLAIARAVILLLAHRRFFELSLLLGVIAYFAVLSAGPEANTRFRLPVAPFLSILAGHGLSYRRAA